jgi:isoquinoline 1-oxidoreductase alpha subunit
VTCDPCGACTVHIDGKAARSCQTQMSTVGGKKVTTIEGLSPSSSIIAHMDGNICRCGTYPRIVRAIERAAREG